MAQPEQSDRKAQYLRSRNSIAYRANQVRFTCCVTRFTSIQLLLRNEETVTSNGYPRDYLSALGPTTHKRCPFITSEGKQRLGFLTELRIRRPGESRSLMRTKTISSHLWMSNKTFATGFLVTKPEQDSTKLSSQAFALSAFSSYEPAIPLTKVDVVAPPAGTRFAPSPMSSIDSQETSNKEAKHDRCKTSGSERQAGEREN
jgi:hypothetical protein